MGTQVTARGFKVVAHHSLKSPESYPPAVARGTGDQNNPQEKDLNGFESGIYGIKYTTASAYDIDLANVTIA